MLEHFSRDIQRSWLAAMIDGEGSIGAVMYTEHVIRRDGSVAYRVRPFVAVTNTNMAIISEVHRMFKDFGRANIVVHTTPTNSNRRREAYRVQAAVFGTVLGILEAVLPFLVGKKGRGSRAEEDGWLRTQLATLRPLNRRGPVLEASP